MNDQITVTKPLVRGQFVAVSLLRSVDLARLLLAFVIFVLLRSYG